MGELELQRQIQELQERMRWFESGDYATVQFFLLGFDATHPVLTSTSWDGDAYSTTARTLIDLSAVFGVPAGVRAVLVKIIVRDSGSAASTDAIFGVSPNSGAYLAGGVRLSGVTNDMYREETFICPCDANGDIYYSCTASGAGTMDVIMQIHGYLL